MRTYKYKTIEALIRANGWNKDWAMSIPQLITGQMWSNTKESVINFKLPDEEYWRVADMAVKTLEYRGDRKEQIASKLKWAMIWHRDLPLSSRLYVSLYKNKADVRYCAGQDYTAELRAIRKSLIMA